MTKVCKLQSELGREGAYDYVLECVERSKSDRSSIVYRVFTKDYLGKKHSGGSFTIGFKGNIWSSYERLNWDCWNAIKADVCKWFGVDL